MELTTMVQQPNGIVKNTPTESVVVSKETRDNRGQKQIDFILALINEFDGQPSTKFMDVAQRYYENDSDIRDKKRMVIGKTMENEAVLQESKILSNNKLQHNFMKKLTRQKIGYMLGRPFTLTAVKPDDTQAKEFFNEVDNYFDVAFFKMMKNIARDSIVKGIGWMMVYYNESGYLKFRRCDPKEIIPQWADSDHTDLESVIRRYIRKEYDGANKKEVTYVEYWTRSGVYYYMKDDAAGTLRQDPRHKELFKPHFYIRPENREEGEEEVLTGMTWSDIPFIPFKYDPDEQSLLKRVKSLIDDYDRRTSAIADSIDDFPNSITVVKNYDGASKEEFVQNKNQYRTIFVQGDGDASSLTTPLNIVDLDTHLERLRQDIYEFGQGVNTADKDIRDTSGVALRFIYADLDMDCVDWGGEMKWSLFRLLQFVMADILAVTGRDYHKVAYDIVFNTDVIINESETILNCLNSSGLISGKTIAANHPWVLDADKEMEDLKLETEDKLELEADYGNNPDGGSTSAKGSTSRNQEIS